jgi:N5-methyltetrahydromethanopterin:coenzyme M methyltransferase subunit E
MTSVTMAHAFVAVFCTVTLCHLINAALGHPFPLPLLGLIWGIALGAAGSATGNPYYGKERQYQNQKFGAGVRFQHPVTSSVTLKPGSATHWTMDFSPTRLAVRHQVSVLV